MAVSHRRSSSPTRSPPKAKRVKTLKKKDYQLVCVEDNEPKKTKKSNKTKASTVQRPHYICQSTIDRAKEVQESLGTEFPSFVKNMLHSHVIHGFWLGLPKRFCDDHMPIQDTMFTLEDEDGKEWTSKYLSTKVGMSGGWRGFSVDHNLVEGDVVVFQLVSRLKFKVYIVRVDGSDNVDCALGLLELDAQNEQVESGDIVACDDYDDDDDDVKYYYGALDQSDKESGDISPEVSDGIRFTDTVVAFKEVKGVENFEILVNGLVINSEMSKYIREKYYELCLSRGNFLHANLLEGLNCKLVAGIISETVNVADAIRASKIDTTSIDDMSIWDKTLKAFEGLAMNVDFLRARLGKLMSLASESKRYEKVKTDKDNAGEELRLLEAKVLEAKERVKRMKAEFETLGADCRDLEIAFVEVASAPW